jgi:hypothetical protein
MQTQAMISQIKRNPRWKTIEAKAEGKDLTEYNLEEINLLNAVVGLEIQEESRAQSRSVFELTHESLKQARRLANWTMCLAVATFILALVAVFKK